MTAKEMARKIGKDTIVSMRYRLKNSRGEVLEERSTVYLHGSPDISPLLQTQLEGLLPGQSKRAFLKKGEEDADDDFTVDVVVETVRDATPAELARAAPIIPVKLHLVTGFLGSGKTTAILQACRYLKKQRIPVAVITNDQGAALVDSGLFTCLGIPAAQVPNGCFCCNYKDLETAIRYLSGQSQPHVIFAESVGSCTDLVATVFKPLLLQHPEWQLSISAFTDASSLAAFDPAVRYIYNKQLEEAPVIVVSKVDRCPTPNLPPEYTAGKTILFQNSFDEAHIARWLQTLNTTSFTSLPSLDIDYDQYGAGEAKLAWLDQQLVIQSPSQQAQQAALTLMAAIAAIDRPIAHLKFLLDNDTKLSFTAAGALDHFDPQPAAIASLLVNARIEAPPADLLDIVASAIQHTVQTCHCSIRTIGEHCFQPGYPRPTHRIA